ncbi:MAG: hypothetical protein KF902_11835 [Phycisphaeraceae bacterium]|nr:hypothetical protein [Phycisphaeraceae bacterium]MCW5769419.1 hypothetical protein [Phycisphaeraceae bacterium]
MMLIERAIAFAYIPFVDPIDAHRWWFLLLIPMAFGVSVVYKAVRMRSLDRYWRHVFGMSASIVLGIILMGAVIYVLIEWVVPRIAPMPG